MNFRIVSFLCILQLPESLGCLCFKIKISLTNLVLKNRTSDCHFCKVAFFFSPATIRFWSLDSLQSFNHGEWAS